MSALWVKGARRILVGGPDWAETSGDLWVEEGRVVAVGGANDDEARQVRPLARRLQAAIDDVAQAAPVVVRGNRDDVLARTHVGLAGRLGRLVGSVGAVVAGVGIRITADVGVQRRRIVPIVDTVVVVIRVAGIA